MSGGRGGTSDPSLARLLLPGFRPDRTIIAPALHLEDDECRVMARAKSHLISDLPRMHGPANRYAPIKEGDLF